MTLHNHRYSAVMHLLVTLYVSLVLSGSTLAARMTSSSFAGMRGKKVMLPFAEEDEDILSKRVPAGFMGLRGKKDPWRLPAVDTLFKRALQGFMGLRGKKEETVAEYEFDRKRAPSGFIGMRGKKRTFLTSSFRPSKGDYSDKRAPFMGMRGKKGEFMDAKRVPSGFYGLRG
ncbi:unnamed protein product [Acanthoscelides obtectus]|uniref:Tachykinin n=1 Tax=Acanthoscelides obtectus TaxID=200917 RepID=A0A9P0M5R0_ACAOB|nr:unnamed protein product [Acanthoscelides obtectus]CAK1649459.1 Tachykinins [Acanthoscelides obtectus]